MNKHLYLCHPLVLSSPTLMMHGHTNLKLDLVFSVQVLLIISSFQVVMAVVD